MEGRKEGRRSFAQTFATVHPFLSDRRPFPDSVQSLALPLRPISFCSTRERERERAEEEATNNALLEVCVRCFARSFPVPIPNTHLGEVEVESARARPVPEIEACTYWIGGDTRMCEERVRREEGRREGGSAKAPKVRGNRPLTPSPPPPPLPPSPISLSGKTSKLVSRDPAHGGIGQRGRRRRGRGRGVYGPQRRRRGGGDGVGGAILGQRVDRGTRTSERENERTRSCMDNTLEMDR